MIHHDRIADGNAQTERSLHTEEWRASSIVMGTLGGFPNPPACFAAGKAGSEARVC